MLKAVPSSVLIAQGLLSVDELLLRWDIQRPGQTLAMPTPMPQWEGVFYEDTFVLPTFKIGDVNAAQTFRLP